MQIKYLALLLVTGCSLSACKPQAPTVNTNNGITLPSCTKEAKVCPDGTVVGRTGPNCEFTPCPEIPNTNTQIRNTNQNLPPATETKPTTTLLIEPVKDFAKRVTKKPFGLYVTPQKSPVSPEIFTGYHTGADAEYDDVTTDVTVVAITDGTVAYASTVSGYGGVVVLRHEINGKKISAVYGHLRPTTVLSQGTKVKAGEKIGLLGTGYTKETDGERKHLHLSLFTGPDIVLTGYAEREDELKYWVDPLTYFPK